MLVVSGELAVFRCRQPDTVKDARGNTGPSGPGCPGFRQARGSDGRQWT